MAVNITLKGIPEPLYERLKTSAEAHHRSLNSEVIACLEHVLQPQRINPQEHLRRLHEIHERMSERRFDHSAFDKLKRQGRR